MNDCLFLQVSKRWPTIYPAIYFCLAALKDGSSFGANANAVYPIPTWPATAPNLVDKSTTPPSDTNKYGSRLCTMAACCSWRGNLSKIQHQQLGCLFAAEVLQNTYKVVCSAAWSNRSQLSALIFPLKDPQCWSLHLVQHCMQTVGCISGMDQPQPGIQPMILVVFIDKITSTTPNRTGKFGCVRRRVDC